MPVGGMAVLAGKAFPRFLWCGSTLPGTGWDAFSEQHHSGTHTAPRAEQLSAGRASHSSPEQFFLVTFTLLQTPRFSGEVAAGLGSAGRAVLTSSASSCQQGAPVGAVAAALLELLCLTPASSSFAPGLPARLEPGPAGSQPPHRTGEHSQVPGQCVTQGRCFTRGHAAARGTLWNKAVKPGMLQLFQPLRPQQHRSRRMGEGSTPALIDALGCCYHPAVNRSSLRDCRVPV